MGDGLRQQRLAGAGRAVEKEALRNTCAESREPLRVAEEVDDLLELGLRVLDPGDVRRTTTDVVEFGSVRFGLTRGISWIVRQIRKTRIAKNAIGSHVSAP